MKQKFVIRCNEEGMYLNYIYKDTLELISATGDKIFEEDGIAVFTNLTNAKTFDTFTEAKIWAKKLTENCMHHVKNNSGYSFDVVLVSIFEDKKEPVESITWWSTTEEE